MLIGLIAINKLNNMCDCIDKLYKQVAEEKDVKYSKIHLSTIMDFNGKNSSMKTGQSITIYRNHKKKDGQVIEKAEKTFITHDYCPFCGVKYK